MLLESEKRMMHSESFGERERECAREREMSLELLVKPMPSKRSAVY